MIQCFNNIPAWMLYLLSRKTPVGKCIKNITSEKNITSGAHLLVNLHKWSFLFCCYGAFILFIIQSFSLITLDGFVSSFFKFLFCSFKNLQGWVFIKYNGFSSSFHVVCRVSCEDKKAFLTVLLLNFNWWKSCDNCCNDFKRACPPQLINMQ